MDFAAAETALLLVDVQPSLVAATMGGGQVLDRAGMLARAAAHLNLPVIATVHVPEKLGGLHPALANIVPEPLSKRTFSCAGDAGFMARLREISPRRLLVAGFEAHVCVRLTASDLVGEGFEPVVLADAVASRTADRCEVALAAMRAGGIAVEHAETALYALMRSPDHPAFREVLALVKGSRY